MATRRQREARGASQSNRPPVLIAVYQVGGCQRPADPSLAPFPPPSRPPYPAPSVFPVPFPRTAPPFRGSTEDPAHPRGWTAWASPGELRPRANATGAVRWGKPLAPALSPKRQARTYVAWFVCVLPSACRSSLPPAWGVQAGACRPTCCCCGCGRRLLPLLAPPASASTSAQASTGSACGSSSACVPLTADSASPGFAGCHKVLACTCDVMLTFAHAVGDGVLIRAAPGRHFSISMA